MLLLLLKIKYLMLVIELKKADYNTKISEIENKIITDHDHDKYITTRELNTQEVNIRIFYCKIKTSKFSNQE